MNNCIVINFPQGCGGHLVGRLIASCDNVVWYDHQQNGDQPWEPYAAKDKNYSRLHFNRRFKGASNQGSSDQMVDSVLDIADKQGLSYTQDSIVKWKQRLDPDHFIYPLHADLDVSRQFFKPAKHIVVIPSDIDLLIDRWMVSSYYYFINGKNRNYLYRDFYQDKANALGISMRECLENDFIKQIDNYKTNVIDDDVVLDEIEDLYCQEVFRSLCNKLQLSFNEYAYNKVIKLCWEHSHL